MKFRKLTLSSERFPYRRVPLSEFSFKEVLGQIIFVPKQNVFNILF